MQEALDNLIKEKKRTTLIVAHRLSTLQNVNQIVVVGQGKVLEMGTHAQLLEKKGHYFSLWEAQMGKHDEVAAGAVTDDTVKADVA